jgi:calcium/calmodulin-dependent protein kinase I
MSIEEYYEITDEVLGEGFFAVVKLGYDKESRERVAIKLINKELVEREETLDNEIDILRSIDHPNVVSMRAIFDTDDILFIVMDLMEGGELYNEIVKRKAFTEADASYIMRQVFDALKYLHSQEPVIVHRDLKLENLLLVRPDSLDIKLADFGLSRIYSGKKLQTACGTPFYVAPEIVFGTGYGPGVDMWAAGVLLYVLLSGRLPFAANTDNELYKSIIRCNLEWKSPQFDSVSEEAKDLISHLITRNPEERWTAEQVLEHPFILSAAENEVHNTFTEGLKSVSRATIVVTHK